MQCVERVEIKSHQADGGEGGRDLAGHNSAFAHTSDYKFGFAICAKLQKLQRFFDLIAPETFSSCGNCSGLFLQAACECRQDWFICFVSILIYARPALIRLYADFCIDRFVS